LHSTHPEDLARIIARHAAGVETLAALASALRPGLLGQETGGGIVGRVTALVRSDVAARAALRESLLQLFAERRAVLLFATSGIFPVRAWLSETVQRIAHRVLPEAAEDEQMHSAVHRIFRPGDARWLAEVPAAQWQALIEALDFETLAKPPGLTRLGGDLQESLRIVAHRVAAESLDPELLRLVPELQRHASPFLSVCEETLELVQLSENGAEHSALGEQSRQVQVLGAQCRDVIQRVRREAGQHGASFALTTKLCRTSQQLDRLETLAALLPDVLETAPRCATAAQLCSALLIAECRRNDLRRYWAQNVELVALRVTENASRSGEHYITRTRPEYFRLLRAAAGGGFVVAWMAAIKFLIAKAALPPLVDILATSLNYGLGFVLIHVVHFAVATKQPAMTANAIAAAIGESESVAGRRGETLDSLIDLVARTTRSQLAAILGNIGVAVPTAILIALCFHQLVTDHHFIDQAKAAHTLHNMHPFASAALIYAAFAGVCLFIAGLVAGYFDNYCAHNRIPERLAQLSTPKRIFGPARWARFTGYVGDNLGALTGNFLLGFLLGGTAGLGVLLGLPIDVRHVTLASAQVGFSLEALDFHPGLWPIAFATLGILLIGITNLVVSFYLAIWVGLKSRGITFAQRRQFLAAVWARMRQRPRQFLLPPRVMD
jgi:site-specific recombinase